MMQALADSQVATVAAMVASMPIPISPAVKVTIGSALAALQLAEQLETFSWAEVESLKLQSILKTRKISRSQADFFTVLVKCRLVRMMHYQCWFALSCGLHWLVAYRAGVMVYSSAKELDSHVNMPAAGGGTIVIGRTGRHATITPFSSTLPLIDMVEILDVAMAYDDPINLKTMILIMRNAVYVPAMDHNLIPPLIIHEAGLVVDETLKFQLASDATINHLIL